MKLLVNLGIFLTLIILSPVMIVLQQHQNHLVQVHINEQQEKKQHVLHQFLVPLILEVPDVNQRKVAHSQLQ